MEIIEGISKAGIKAFNEGNVLLEYPKRNGQWEKKEYTSSAWVKKALLKARKDGRYVKRVSTLDSDSGSVVRITFSDKGFGFIGDCNAYRQFSTYPDTVTIIRPMSWEYGFIRKKKYL